MKNWSDGDSDPIADLLSMKRKDQAKQNIFQVWREGYSVTENKADAELLGYIRAETFEQAVLNYYMKHPSVTFDAKNLTDWGMRHFDNEQDARKSFG